MAGDSRAWARTVFAGDSIAGEEQKHLSAAQLELALEAAQVSFVSRWGLLEAVVVRCNDGSREQPIQCLLTVDGGLSGDRWSTGKAKPGDQISMMNLDVAATIANGQSIALFGDNLFTRLDLREENLPVGARLRVGEAILEISARPHMPCDRFRARFGAASFERTAKEPRLRGVYLTVIEGGSIALGDPIRRA